MVPLLPYSFENGNLIRYELNGEDDIDHTIDLDNYAVAQTTPFDVDSFKTVNDLLIKILLKSLNVSVTLCLRHRERFA